jgi:hypothetical protein
MSLLCVPEASASDNTEFLETEQISEVELGVAAERNSCLLLLVLGDFSEHPVNYLSREPASTLRCIALLEGSCCICTTRAL